MTNEIAAALIFLMWFIKGRELNLCFVIFIYYAIYLSTRWIPSELVYLSDVNEIVACYILQSAIDTLIIALIFIILSKYKASIIFCLPYAAMVAVSLLCNSLMALDQAFEVNYFYKVHLLRQSISFPIDLSFAFLGSGLFGYLASNFTLPTRRRSDYNRFNDD